MGSIQTPVYTLYPDSSILYSLGIIALLGCLSDELRKSKFHDGSIPGFLKP